MLVRCCSTGSKESRASMNNQAPLAVVGMTIYGHGSQCVDSGTGVIEEFVSNDARATRNGARTEGSRTIPTLASTRKASRRRVRYVIE